ncbi:YfcL family protein [Colwellia sp. MEBiC06753]
MFIENLTGLYHYFDQLAEHDADADTLFASSYIRGFIALIASDLGDESQPLSTALAKAVSAKLAEAKTELTPQDQVIVANYWQSLLPQFRA